MGPRWWLLLVVNVAGAFTLLVSGTSIVSFAYRSPSLHVAVETAAGLISLLAAQLMYGRFRRSLDRRDLILMASLVLFAGSNLLFSTLPAMANLESDPFVIWAPAIGGALATALLAAGAFAAPRAVRRPKVVAGRIFLVCLQALAIIALVVLLTRDWLPAAIEPSLSPEASTRPRIVGEPALLALQLVVMALFAVAAVGFERSHERTLDPLMFWFSIGATLAAFARLNYFLFPSQFSEYFYTGDVLRLGFFVSLLIGGALEIRVAQRELEHAAVVNERRRLAREIHDGMAQDLAFIVQQASALAGRDGASPTMADIETAARRALAESRNAIDALVRPTGEPLDIALKRVAEEAAGRWDAAVHTQAIAGLELEPQAREALLRIVGEAVTNAARHGHAKRIRLELEERPELQVRVVDDGVGFDAATLRERSGHHGITGMRERAEAVGGQLEIDSAPGRGTTVVVTLP
jgi:signal transduction histidine kinase